MGLGVVLSLLSCSPLVFFLCLRSFPFRCFPLGFCPLTEWVGMSVSSLLVYSSVWLEGSCCNFFLSACALFSLLLVHWIFWASPAPLACWGGWGFTPCVRVFQLRCCLLGLQVGFPCCLFLTLEWGYFWLRCLQSLWATKAVSAAIRGSSSSSGVCWSISFFLELGWFLVTRWWLLLRLLVLVSSDARSHIPDAFASSSTPISGCWMVLAPVFFLRFALGSSFSLPMLAAGSGWLRFFLSCPTSVAPLRWLLPWFFVGYLLAGHRGAAVPLSSGVGASVGCSALRPAAACALFPGVPLWGCGFWGVSWFSPLCSPGRRSASRFT